jgi:hypothetical protein
MPKEYVKHRFNSFVIGQVRKNGKRLPHRYTRVQADAIIMAGQGRLAESFMQKIRQVHKQGFNCLIVFEGLHMMNSGHIKSLADFLYPHWDVQVTLASRPLYEWLPSKYNSIRKPGSYGKSHRWPGEKMKNGDVAEPVHGFDLEERGDFTEMVHQMEGQRQHPAATVRDNFRLFFDNVKVIPLNRLPPPSAQGDAVLEHLFCHLFDTPNTCQAVLRGKIGSLESAKASNPSVSLNYDIIAVQAWRDGIVPASARREIVRNAVERYQKGKGLGGDDFPLTCLPESTLERIETMSLEFERDLYADEWSRALEEQHKAGFEATKGKNKYCSVDAKLALLDQGLRNYLASQDWNALRQGTAQRMDRSNQEQVVGEDGDDDDDDDSKSDDEVDDDAKDASRDIEEYEANVKAVLQGQEPQ